ncbi:unnamed protein product [Prorocentrum cordatum]|uniref:Uncharacterized protein n=1 Tax=Prorocentrum cordatum TaxID=2364126 RepID=A0ABN9USL3_9DINO|nr:unnamed protein product [Polarella glacialis]
MWNRTSHVTLRTRGTRANSDIALDSPANPGTDQFATKRRAASAFDAEQLKVDAAGQALHESRTAGQISDHTCESGALVLASAGDTSGCRHHYHGADVDEAHQERQSAIKGMNDHSDASHTRDEPPQIQATARGEPGAPNRRAHELAQRSPDSQRRRRAGGVTARVVLEIDGRPGCEPERHELGFTGLMEHASGRHEDGVLGFASGVQHTALPFSARLTILEYPLHLAVQTYVGLNFNTMALLCQGFDFGPMDLACVMDLWLQSDQLRRVPEGSVAEVVKRTLRFVKLEWSPVVRISFIVCMHSCWPQAKHTWWHASLIWSCAELEVWRGPADGKPGAGTFRTYVAQIVQHALSPHPEVFIAALQDFVEGLPLVTVAAIEAFFSVPDSISDPIAIAARHYLQLLHVEDERSVGAVTPICVPRGDERLSDFGGLSPVTLQGFETPAAAGRP